MGGSRTTLALLLAACSFDHGREAGGDGGDSGGPIVFAVASPIAGPGELVAIDGILGDGPVTVQFASGATAMTAGGEHAVVIVPAGAGTGTLVVSNAVGSNSAVPLRGATFAVHSGIFAEDEIQTDFARVGARLPAPLSYAGVVATQRYLFVLGGDDVNGAPQSTVLRARMYADGTLSAFETVGALTTARAGAAVALAGSRIVVAGGRDAAGALGSTETALVHADGTLDGFAAGPSLPEPRVYAGAAIVGGGLIIAGGETDDGVPHADVYRAALTRDAMPGSFATIEALPTARSRFGLAVVRSRLVALGGRGTGGGGTASVEAAPIGGDGSIGTFVSAPPLGFARYGLGAYGVGAELCVVGGSRLEVECATVDTDGTPATFAKRSSLRAPSVGATAVVVPDRVWLVAGGRAQLAFASLDRGAVPASFAPGVALAAPSRDVACAVVGDYLYVLAGIDASNVATTTIQRAPIDERGVIGTFEMYPRTLAIARRAHQTVVLDGAIAVIGGANSGGDLASTELLEFDATGELQVPATGSMLTVDRRGPRAAVVDRTLYVVGGRGNTTPSRTWESASVSRTSFGAFSGGVTQIGASRAFYASALLDGGLLVFGSADETDVESAPAGSAALGSFSVVAQLNAARENHMAAWVGDRIWAIGGFDSNGTVTTIEAADAGGTSLAFTVRAALVLPVELATGGCAIRLRDHLHLVGGSASSALSPTIYSAVLQ